MSSNSTSNIFQKLKQKLVPITVNLAIVLLFILFAFFRSSPLGKWLNPLENLTYDFQVRSYHRPLEQASPITIVDVDDKSLKAKGRWPWSRKTLAELVNQLFKAGAAIIAFDITFPEAEDNVVHDVIHAIKEQPTPNQNLITQLKGLQSVFDYDEQFAKSLALGDTILGMVFSNQGESSGYLPAPFLILDNKLQNKLAIPEKAFYLSSIPVLQKAAKNAGFINADQDPDGVLRFSNLLVRRGNDLYASLSLAATSMYLLTQKIELLTERYEEATVLEGIQLDQLKIPTDPQGRILIPYRGYPFSFPYVSASDVIDGKFDPSSIQGKLIFIGFSASALADLYPTSMSPAFPGVEVHATIASGIIDQYLPYKPYWGKGLIFLLILLCGVLCALLLPYLGAIASSLLCLALTSIILMADYRLWTHEGLVLTILLPLALIWILYIFNIVWGYFMEARKGKELKSMFGQYVPPAYLDEMIRKGGEINLEGKSKELSVLFSDIRSFTSLSEKMTASEVKKLLNRFFNPITEVIFNHKGTIDKYVGDMVMAFWGAPLDDPKHALQAVSTALEMQEKLAKLNESFKRENKPQIKIGIGVNTGTMNVGDMGSKFRRSYTVIGDEVNLASRLEGQSKFYHLDILVGEKTWLQTKDDVVYRKIDKIKVKGKETAVLVFQPICKIQNLTPQITQELEIHHQALEAYFQQDWETASKLFEKLKATYPDNAAFYDVYLTRIGTMRTHPYKQDWDGSYISLEK